MDLAIDLIDRNRDGLEDRLPHLVRILAVESLALRDHLVEDSSQAEHIRARIDRISRQLLGRHVVQDLRGLAGGLGCILTCARNAEAQNLYNAIPLHHDLRRFKAIMKNFSYVRVVKPLAGLSGDILQIPDGKSFFTGQHGGDAVALHVFHGRAQVAVNFSGAVQ